MKTLKKTSESYNRFTADREIVNTIPLTDRSDNTNPTLFCYAEFKYDDAPNYSILVAISDIIDS